MRMLDIPVLFLKATIKKMITVPGYYRKDGTFVPPHQKSVHFDPDKDSASVLGGNGSHSQKQAHKKLHASVPGFAGLNDDEKLAHILSSATNIQNKATASSAMSTWKKLVMAGKDPSVKLWDVFYALPKDQQEKLKAQVGKEQFDKVAGSVEAKPEPVEPAKPKVEPHPVGKLVKVTASGADYGEIGEITKVHENSGIGGADIPAYSVKGTDGPYGHGEVEPASNEEVAAHQKGKADADVAQQKVKELVAGTGGHYPVKAAKMLTANGAWQMAGPVEQLSQIVALAKKLQAAATASAAVSGHKAFIDQGKVPTKAQIHAFLALPEDKQVSALQAMIKKHGLDHVMKLHNGAIEKHVEGKKPAAESAPADDMPWPATKAAGFIKEGKPVPAELLSKIPDADKAKLVAKVAKETGQSPIDIQALLMGQNPEQPVKTKTTSFGADNPGVEFATDNYKVKYNGQSDEWEYLGPKGWEPVVNELLISSLNSGETTDGKPLIKVEPAKAPKVSVLENKTLYHATSEKSASAIHADGFKVSSIGAIGLGIYFAENKDATNEYGDTVVSASVSGKFAEFASFEDMHAFLPIKVAVEKVLGKPIESFGSDAFDVFSDVIGDQPKIINDALNGYDGVKMTDSGYFCVFDPQKSVSVNHAAPKVAKVSVVKVPLAAKKLQAINPAEVQAWLDWTKTKKGPPPVGFFEHANKQAHTKFFKWHNNSQKFGYPDHWKAAYRAAAVGSLFGMPDQVLMKDGSWKKMAHVSVNDTANIVTDVAQIHAAAVAAKGGPKALGAAPSDSGWEYSANDMGFSGADVVMSEGADGSTHYVAFDSENNSFEIGSMTDGDAGPYEYYDTPEKVVSYYKQAGLTPPPLEFLQKMQVNGPKDGDTKPAADGGTLVFKDGRWHKQDEPKVLFTKKAKIKTDSSGKPIKPESIEADNMHGQWVQTALDNLDEAALQMHVVQLKDAKTPSVKAVLPFAEAALAYVKDKLDNEPDVVQAGAEEQVFHNTSEGHNKFWSISVDPATNTVTKKWGKIGTAGQSQQYHYSSLDTANNAAKEWIAEKAKKGYYPHSINISKPAAPKVASVKSASVKPNDVESIDGWNKIGGQGGYNPGGTYTDANGDDWYCKFPTSGEAVIKNELLATKLYAAAGIKVPEVKIVKQGGKLGIASKIVSGATQSKEKLLAGKANGLLDGFAVDAWLANWDVVGNNPASGKGWDNILFVGDDAHRIDAGGAMLYGGAGGKKSAFGDEVIELKTMLDSKKNDRTAAVFGKMSQADITASVAKVLAIPETTIKALVNQFGPGSQADKDKLAATLINRQADMASKYPKASAKSKKKKNPIVFDPSKLGEPPDFMNWSGSGQHGPATMEAKNVANHEGVRKLYQVAKQGNIDLLKLVEFPVYGPDGAITGKCSAFDHKSQYVRSYAQQLINEIDFQLNPPKVFRFRGDSQIGDIASAFPVLKHIASAAKKLGYYVLLGHSDTFPAAEVFKMPKLSWSNGKISTKTFVAQSNAALAKIPKLQKDALRSYTGSGYHEQNLSLWKGNPSGAAESAAAALHTHAYDLPAGMLLSRKIKLTGSDLVQMVGKDLVNGSKHGQVGVAGATGTVLQEPAIQSTSIRPSSWSGNVQLKMTVGPGVKGIYVGEGTNGSGGTGTNGFSQHPSEHELILPPNTRMLVQRVLRSNHSTDADGFGNNSEYIVEVLILPNGDQ